MSRHLKGQHPDEAGELAVALIARCRRFVTGPAALAYVLPTSWLTIGTFENSRRQVLAKSTLHLVVWLGTGAFDAVTGHVVNVVLIAESSSAAPIAHLLAVVDARDRFHAEVGRERPAATMRLR